LFADNGKDHHYQFSRVFGPDTEQEEMFEEVGIPAVQNVLKGYNSTLFVYGQTGSGKTYTMGLLESNLRSTDV